MPYSSLPHYLRPRREKVFGDGRPRPLDRNAKARAVAEALLWGFHNAQSGLCFPSYEKIAEKAVAPARPSPRP